MRVRDLAGDPTLRGLCVGYEGGVWRQDAFARHVIEWLPEFALDYSEREAIGHHNCVKAMGKAAESVYTSDKYQKRGEFGEIFLHIALRQDCDSTPAISKLYFKSANNDTVKGFDAVHVVGTPGDLELWLGEVKFYDDIGHAIRDVTAELDKHTQTNYLRSEFMWIGNKLDPADAHSAEIQRLLDRNVSLDKIFKRICVPVLLTYDSPCVAAHSVVDPAYSKAFEAEIRKHWAAIVGKGLPPGLRIHVILLPLQSKKALVTELDRRLKLCQAL
ncbi:MAG: DUF1837 domain-containing protein [Planctomycetota bacterium]|nr:DUF1837 domain-containing protein [Planctomycetota bacterium]